MLICLKTLALLLLVLLSFSFSYGAEKRIVAIAYHDVVEKKDQLVSDAVTLDTLINHFEWLLVSGYQPVSITDLLAARTGEKHLPDKPILLCWDDGYKSFYTHVLPLLKAYNFPAVLALVGEWMSAGRDETVLYGNNYVPRDKFLSWQEVKAVHKSGLVEIASHSMSLHKAVLADTSGDMLPAAITYAFDPATFLYETEAEYAQRIRVDLESNSRLIAAHLGEKPRVMVWPFGRYNEFTLKIARDVGMEVTLTLDPVSGSLENLAALGRVYPTLNPETGTLRADLKEKRNTPLRRFMRVKMSDLIEEDPQSEFRFSKLLERIHALQIGAVVFEPILEIDGGIYALFANSYLPVVQDRLLRLLWHTDRRGGAEAILWLSKTIFNIEKNNLRLEVSGTSPPPPSLFSDLGKAAPCSGVIIDHKSFAKSLFTSVSAFSQTYWEKTHGADVSQKRHLRRVWRNTGAFPEDSLELLENIEKIQEWQPFIEVALLVTPEMLAEASVKQIAAVLSGFDYLVLELGDELTLPDNIAAFRPYFVPLLEYESKNRNGEKKLAQQFGQLTREGFINHAYADDHFLDNSPSPAVIRETISIGTYPVRPR